MSHVELWGGIECTVNRVHERYHNQLEFSGHAARLSDLDRVAELGIRTLRYPLLWEVIAAQGVAHANWSWADTRMERLQALGIAPIIGLVHHGSGPRHTSLVGEDFAAGLAEYAGAVAQRYPWIEAYTPVNEPLTTARFSGLYGLWYPHATDAKAFARALLQQCRGVVLSMRAIRRVNSAAKLVQTDDLGKVYSTPRLAYQAQFENERRWLAWDLLCGRVDRTHALYEYLIGCGVEVGALHWFLDNACPPDIIGINHYVTSDRFLHQNRQWCSEQHWGGNGRERYADTEAVRVRRRVGTGAAALLLEAWQRYHLPIAITEAHLGCTRDEQLRWLHEMWRAAHRSRQRGADVRAVTVWALFGSFDWNSLLTRFSGHYEPGAFDVRSPAPRPTALAALTKKLAAGIALRSDPILSSPGWWRRPTRLLHGVQVAPRAHSEARRKIQPLLITGATGTLGRAFARACEARALRHVLFSRADMDLADATSIDRAIDAVEPWSVINAAGYVRVDDAEGDRERCYRENSTGAAQLASACASRNLPLLTFSSDLVFDGRSVDPYVESDPARPLNVYGLSKARAEGDVLRRHPATLIVRTSAFFGPWDSNNFITVALRTLAADAEFIAIDDLIVSPTYVPDLANAALDLLIDGAHGIWHLANRGAISWAELALRAAHLVGIDAHRLIRTGWRQAGLVAQRPAYSVLGSERGLLLPDLDDGLSRYAAAIRSRVIDCSLSL